jgi:hypothetical protein
MLSFSEICKITSLINKPIFAFRILRGNNQNEHSVRLAIRNTFSIPNLHGIIIGLRSLDEIDLTLPIAFNEIFEYERQKNNS